MHHRSPPFKDGLMSGYMKSKSRAVDRGCAANIGWDHAEACLKEQNGLNSAPMLITHVHHVARGA